MSPKEQLLQDLAHALANNTLTREEVEALLPAYPQPVPQIGHAPQPVQTEGQKKNVLSVIDILFYLAGIILFSALMTMVAQVGDDDLITQLFVSLGAGLMFWVASYLLAINSPHTEVKEGLVNAMLLTGSLSVSVGGFLLTNHLTYIGSVSSDSSNALVYAALLAILGIAHYLFDRLLRNPILIIFALLLFVASFPTAMVGLLAGFDEIPADVWGIISIITGALLAFGGRLISISAANRAYFKHSFESLAGFIILGSIYGLGFASVISIFWQLLLPLTIYIAFFISIKRRSKQFLLTGSLFLVLFLITISFRYFSGFGAAFSLILSAFSILATAFVAASINKKYIKVQLLSQAQ